MGPDLSLGHDLGEWGTRTVGVTFDFQVDLRGGDYNLNRGSSTGNGKLGADLESIGFSEGA